MSLQAQEIPPGYKRTEVGVIPEDWEVQAFENIAYIERGKFTARPRNDPKYYGGDIPFIQTGDVTNSNGLIGTYSQTLNAEGLKVSKLFQRGTLFFTIAANIGDVGFTTFDAACPDSLVAITPKLITEKRWLAYELAKRKSSFESIATHNAQLNINLEKLRPYLLPLPPLPEQRAIAEALGDVDALLGGLDRLIAKKRDLKQAAMQALLTPPGQPGHHRLPGFEGEWVVRRLGDVCRITTGKKDVNEGNPDGRFPFFTCSRSHTFSDLYSFDTEAILIAGNGEVGNLHYYNGKFEAYQRTYVLSDFAIQVRYLWQKLSARLADSLGLGKIGSSIPYIKKENLTQFEFVCPKDPPEQTAIVEVLSDMDAELAALERRREKTAALKQGMMQELLTGRTRLV